MKSIKDIIEMKNQPSSPFENAYQALFLTIENDLIAKIDGGNRIKAYLSEYDELGLLYIIHQFVLLKNDYIAEKLISIFNVDISKVISTEDYEKLEKNLFRL